MTRPLPAFFLLTALLTIMAACAAGPQAELSPAEKYFVIQKLPVPEEGNIPHCHGYGCKHRATVELDEAEWAEIASGFAGIENAAAERAAVSEAIGAFERVVGRKAGTGDDRKGTYVRLGTHQHDCIDESSNTTIYLYLLQKRGLLRFHDLYGPTTRLPLIGGRIGPHRSAVITERGSGNRYAVDSWFHDNGRAAEIVPLGRWRRGWQPD